MAMLNNQMVYIYTMNHSYWSYVHQLSYRTGPHFAAMQLVLPSGYLTVSHGKIRHAIKNGKPSISMAIYTIAMLVITRG